MPLNFPSSPTNGQQYTDDNAIVWEFDGVKWTVITGTANKSYSGVRLGLTADYALTSVSTAVTFDNESFDTDGYFTVSAPTRITFIRSAFYRINLSVYTSSLGASYTISIKKNGATTLATAVIAPNQFTNYDEIIELAANDYIEVYADDSNAAGSLTDKTFIEVTRLGLSMGTFVKSADAFSGARAVLTGAFNTTDTSQTVTWNATSFDQNANPAGDSYWDSGSASRLTVKISGFYRLKTVIEVGALDIYTLELKKNGATTLSTTTVAANGYAQIDEIYELAANDYLELYVNDANSTGSLLDSSYLEITRLGV